jgi:hypothetical protein
MIEMKNMFVGALRKVWAVGGGLENLTHREQSKNKNHYIFKVTCLTT